ELDTTTDLIAGEIWDAVERVPTRFGRDAFHRVPHRQLLRSPGIEPPRFRTATRKRKTSNVQRSTLNVQRWKLDVGRSEGQRRPHPGPLPAGEGEPYAVSRMSRRGDCT